MKNATNITVILDRSGSMYNDRAKTVEGFNAFLQEQKDIEGEATITLVQFAEEFTTSYKDVNLSEAKFIKQKTNMTLENFVEYNANGQSTSLRDTVGSVIANLGYDLSKLTENERPDKVIIVIITDGEDNSSRRYSLSKLKEMIEHQQKVYNWTFLYLGADMSGVNEARSMGIDINTVASYKGTQNIKTAYRGASLYAESLRSRSSLGSLAKAVNLQDLLDKE